MKKLFIFLLLIGMLGVATAASDTYTLRIIIPDAPQFINLINHTHTANTTFEYNLNATDEDGISCFIFNDTSTFDINCSGFIQNTTSLENVEIYWINVTVNDTINTLTSGVFYINITPDYGRPVVRIYNPENQSYFTYYKMDLQLLVGANKEISEWNYNINGTNVTFTPNTTIEELGINDYNLTVYAEDATGNVGNSTVYFRVGYENEKNTYYYLYFFIFALAVTLLIVGWKIEDPIIVIFSGMLFIVMGVIIWTVGYPSLTNELLKKSISFVLWGVGAYLLVIGSNEIIEESDR